MDYPLTILDRLRDSPQDVSNYYLGCLLPYIRNNGRRAYGRLVEIITAGDGNHTCRLEVPVNNFAVQAYRPSFRVPASRVLAHSQYHTMYFNAGEQGRKVAWYMAWLGARTRCKGLQQDTRSDYVLMDYRHTQTQASPPPMLLVSYLKHQLGEEHYPSLEEALASMSNTDDGVPAVALSKEFMIAGKYNEEGELTHVALNACGLPLVREIPVNQVAETLEALL